MAKSNSAQRAIARVTLSQRKYEDGALYLSQVIGDEDVLALDVRFFHEDGDKLRPTRAGFRIPGGGIAEACRILLSEPSSINDVMWSDDRRQLFARYVDDEYGQALDIRYYSSEGSYIGWEKRGIRFRLEDFARLQTVLREVEGELLEAWVHSDLFGERVIETQKDATKAAPRHRGTKKKRSAENQRGASGFVNEVIRKLIG